MTKGALMEIDERRAAENEGGGTAALARRLLGVASFVALFVLNLLRGKWVAAAFFLATALLFLKGREADAWPKAVRYPLVILYAALAVVMFVTLIQDFKALG